MTSWVPCSMGPATASTLSLPMLGWDGGSCWGRCAGSALSLVLQGTRTRVSYAKGAVGVEWMPPSHPILPLKPLQPPHCRLPVSCQPSRVSCPPVWSFPSENGMLSPASMLGPQHPCWDPNTLCHLPVCCQPRAQFHRRTPSTGGRSLRLIGSFPASDSFTFTLPESKVQVGI